MAAQYVTLLEANREIGPNPMLQRGAANGTAKLIGRDVYDVAVRDGDLSAFPAEDQTAAAAIIDRLTAKVDEVNALVDSAVRAAGITRLPATVPTVLRWAALELLRYELKDEGRNDSDLEQWQHARDFLDRVRSGAERIPGAMYCQPTHASGIVSANIRRA